MFKKIIFTLLIGSSFLFAQAGKRVNPAWKGFQEILPSTAISSADTTKAAKVSDAYGYATFWFHITADNTLGDVTVDVLLYNKKIKSWGTKPNKTTVTLSGMVTGDYYFSLDDFGTTWTVGDSAKFIITPASGSFTTSVYLGIE